MKSAAKILVVEDVRHLAYFLKHHLNKAGYEVDVVYRGDTVVERVESYQPDAVILDVGLPGMSGLDVCKKLKADPRHKDLVILIATGHAFDASIDEVTDAGADWHFSKPLSPATLMNKLQELGIVNPPTPVGTSGGGVNL